MIETIQESNNLFYFFIFHSLITWNAEFLSMNTLSNRKSQIIPLTIACLTVGRYGIMDDRPYPILLQKSLQFITLFAQYRENMIHTFRWRWKVYN